MLTEFETWEQQTSLNWHRVSLLEEHREDRGWGVSTLSSSFF